MRKLVWMLVTIAAFGLIAFSTTKKHQQVTLQTFPFDPDLSLLASVEGDFHNFSGEGAHLTLTPTISVYTPDEPFQELEAELPSDEWIERVIQSFDPSQLPEGWIYFSPLSDLTLHFTVEDKQARLEKVVVKDWEGQNLGEVPASADRKQVSGSLIYSPSIEVIVLEIWGVGSSSQLLARAVSTTPKAEDGFWYETEFGFHPDPANPRSKDVLATSRVPLHSSHDYRAKYPDNDSPDAKPERPKDEPFKSLTTKEKIKNTTDPSKAPPKIVTELSKRISEIAAKMETSELALDHAILPPFSREIEATWEFSTTGRGYAWIVVPYHGSPERKWTVKLEISAGIEGKKPPPKETSEVAATWAIQAKFTQEEKTKWQVEDPVPIGDLWGIEVSSPPIIPKVSAKSILQEVTVRINRDKICGAIAGGSVTIGKIDVLPDVGYYTDPRTRERKRIPPPYDPPAPDRVTLDSNAVGKAQCPKGFRYVFKDPALKTFPAIYEITPTEQTKDVPPTTNVEFDAKLTNVAVLKVYVYTSKPDFLTTANVWLYKQNPDGSFPPNPTITAGTQRVKIDGKEYEVATITNVQLNKQPDGTFRAVYKVKVFLSLDIPHTPYENLWTLDPTCEEVRSVTVQLKEGQGPGEGSG